MQQNLIVYQNILLTFVPAFEFFLNSFISFFEFLFVLVLSLR
jgi:hypothetical protein